MLDKQPLWDAVAATACAFHVQHLCWVQSQLAECKAPWVILALLECVTTVCKLGASQTLAFIRSVRTTGQRNSVEQDGETPLSALLSWGGCKNCNCTGFKWSQEAETSVRSDPVSGVPQLLLQSQRCGAGQGHPFLLGRNSFGPAC